MDREIFIKVENLKKEYRVGNGFKDFFSKNVDTVKAIDDISFNIYNNEILGLVGESGSGKTTTGEILVKLQDLTSGKIQFQGHDFNMKTKSEEMKFRKEVQMIFQDPYETLNPRFTIFDTIAEPLKIQGIKDQDTIRLKVIEALNKAELRPAEFYCDRYPHELSGGQRQRVAIARAIVLDPLFLVADEPVSMLDVSIRADILNLLKSFKDTLGLTMLYVSHDLSTIKYLCDRIAVMYLGKIVEIGDAQEVISSPKHPYTKVLLSSVPIADPDYVRESIEIDDELPDQINLPKGCRFGPRCPYFQDICLTCDHELIKCSEGHYTACIIENSCNN